MFLFIFHTHLPIQLFYFIIITLSFARNDFPVIILACYVASVIVQLLSVLFFIRGEIPIRFSEICSISFILLSSQLSADRRYI